MAQEDEQGSRPSSLRRRGTRRGAREALKFNSLRYSDCGNKRPCMCSMYVMSCVNAYTVILKTEIDPMAVSRNGLVPGSGPRPFGRLSASGCSQLQPSVRPSATKERVRIAAAAEPWLGQSSPAHLPWLVPGGCELGCLTQPRASPFHLSASPGRVVCR